jgi:hypothetical protein
MSIIATCNCTTYRNVTLTFTAPVVAPSNGYRVRWRSIIDETVVPNIVTPYTEFYYNEGSGGAITINGVPRCCKVEVELTASCSNGQFGTPQTQTIAANATYTATLTTVSCANGDGIYRLSGTPGQIAVVRLQYGGSIAHNGTNGTCAYLFGKITSGNSSSEGTSYSTPIGSTSPTTVSMVTAPQISVTIPSQGNAEIQTRLVAYNAVSTSGTLASLQLVSIDNQPVNLTHNVSCMLSATNSNPICGVAP